MKADKFNNYRLNLGAFTNSRDNANPQPHPLTTAVQATRTQKTIEVDKPKKSK